MRPDKKDNQGSPKKEFRVFGWILGIASLIFFLMLFQPGSIRQPDITWHQFEQKVLIRNAVDKIINNWKSKGSSCSCG